MGIGFVIRDWAAWSPGLPDAESWRQWSREGGSLPLGGAATPAAAATPPLLRRRLNLLGRMAVDVAAAVDRPGLPSIWSSRYGDAGRSLALLADLAQDQPLSPTAFSLSVHNAIGAVAAMATGNTAPQTALAGGAASAGFALLEALGRLHESPAAEVLLVHYDMPLPPDWASFADDPPATYAWAWRLAAVDASGPGSAYTLALRADIAEAAEAPVLPFGLDLHRAVIDAKAQWQRRAGGQCWSLTRHG